MTEKQAAELRNKLLKILLFAPADIQAQAIKTIKLCKHNPGVSSPASR